MGAPRFKILIEGVQVPARSITRVQVEGESARAIINLWPTNTGTQISRGSQVVIFRWENDSDVLKKLDKEFTDYGVWELFFDGYIDRKPTISRRENRALVIYCVQYINRLNSVYIRTTSLGVNDFGSLRDRAFMGINLEPNKFFTVDSSSVEVSAITRIKNRLGKEGVAKGLISIMGEAVNYDDLYARVAETTNFYARIAYADNETINTFVEKENLIDVVTKQVDHMPTKTTLIQVINQLMYQSLYTMISVASPKYSRGRKQAGLPTNTDDQSLKQFIYKPQLFFAVPIKSNIIFPSTIDSMEPIQTRVDQPTRIAVVGYNRMLGKNNGSMMANKAYYPETIAKNFTLDMKAQDQLDFDNGKYTEEELLEDRLVPREVGLPFPEGLMSRDDGTMPEGGLAKIYGNYIFHLDKNTAEPLQIQVAFDPYLICGISGVILDEQFGYVFGRYRTITDVIDIDSGVAKTTVEVVNVRLVPGTTTSDGDLQIPDYDKLFTGDTAFFDTKFNNDGISDSFYIPMFGSAAIHNDVDQYYKKEKGYDHIAGALSGLFKMFKGVGGDHIEKFVRSIKYRPVITEAEYMDFIGAIPNGDASSGRYASQKGYKSQYQQKTKPGSAAKPFMEERQKLVNDYVKDLRESRFAELA